MVMFLLLILPICHAMVHRHPSKYIIIKGEPYINYYTISGYTGFDKLDPEINCDYNYKFNNNIVCCDFINIKKVSITLNFDKNISLINNKRHLINSLRNIPDNWVQFHKIINYTYVFTFMTTNMFKADEDNLIEDTKYLDNFKSYSKKSQVLTCQKSDFKLIQEANDANFVDIIIIIAAVIIIMSAIKNCSCNRYHSTNYTSVNDKNLN